MLSVSIHMPNLVKIHYFILKILSGNKILISLKGRYSVTNYQKWMLDNLKLDVVNTNASAKFGHNPYIYTQEIERK